MESSLSKSFLLIGLNYIPPCLMGRRMHRTDKKEQLTAQRREREPKRKLHKLELEKISL